ncbi:MAG: aminotransferase class III-fold pyridoxal phosphate-dependent enzyme, partial [Alphaproteobacteria bacterium]
SAIPQNPFATTTDEARRALTDTPGGEVRLGRYGEPRLVYTSPDFYLGRWKGSDRRTVHLGIDIFAPAGTDLHAPMVATVVAASRHAGPLGYGASVVLRHQTGDGDPFYTLYGHLDHGSVAALTVGATLAKGERFARLGGSEENGGWAPHVHLQLALSIDSLGDDWPGVARAEEMDLWQALCPNPAALLNLPDERCRCLTSDPEAVQQQRRRYFGDNVKLSYRRPVMFVRGWQHYLFDVWGRPYLDAYNNVPHVGHAHPRLQAVAAEQLKRMNSNTRYLHPAQAAFAEKLLSKMPENLSVCFFVNSGSEANELALRLVRAHTGGKDMITPDHGYHGNTTGAIDISAYKFNRPGGTGRPDWVQLVDVADEYRGAFRRDVPDRAEKFAAGVDQAIVRISERGGQLAGFIAETLPSVGGQIIPPAGYLASVYNKIRAAGGLCIADEVQTGLGRLGAHYFGFEQQVAKPDIVVLGKPIGNGHPIGVVVTTRTIADSFANGVEYFSTFGGSTLSCVIGKTVLDIVDDEGLQENARVIGRRLLDGLRHLQDQHPCIGDVRGVGFFIGVELVTDRDSRDPATQIADHVVNRLRDQRVLIGVEGPHDNVLKIRPPLTMDDDGVDQLLTVLDHVLCETAVRGAGDQR